MAFDNIQQKVKKQLDIKLNGFKILLYDAFSKQKRILDEEFVEELHGLLSHKLNKTLCGEIIPDIVTSGFDVVNQCNAETESNQFECIAPPDWNSTDNGNTVPEEVSMLHHQENEPECFEKLLFTTSDTESDDSCSSNNDEINRNICQCDVSLCSNENRLCITEMTDLAAPKAIQNILDIIVQQPSSTGAIPVESTSENWNNENSQSLLPDLPGQIVQEMPSVPLSSSLQFVHDVQPCQKTQHNMDSLDECSDKGIPPYIMRIQGIKTQADKGKSILPRLKLPRAYNSIRRRRKLSLSLIVAAIREETINDQRFLYTCEDIQFLPNNINKETDAVNPIQLTLSSLKIQSDRTFELSLRLINKSSRTITERNKNKLFHKLDDEIARRLHPTSYDPQFFRLACTLVQDNTVIWNTLCLSDYIRPKQRLRS